MPLRHTDDTAIADDATLWRRICNQPSWIKEDKDGQIRPSSAAFIDNYTNEVSVHLASLTTQEKVTNKYPDDGLVSIKAGIPRSQNHIVASDPIIDEEDPTNNDSSHCVICPPEGLAGKPRKAAARIMAGAAKWLLYPESQRR